MLSDIERTNAHGRDRLLLRTKHVRLMPAFDCASVSVLRLCEAVLHYSRKTSVLCLERFIMMGHNRINPTHDFVTTTVHE